MRGKDFVNGLVKLLEDAGVKQPGIDAAIGILGQLRETYPGPNNPGQVSKSEGLADGEKRCERGEVGGGKELASAINVIPSPHGGPCRDLLVVVNSGGGDKLHLRLTQAVDSCIRCCDVRHGEKRKCVLVVTDTWHEPKEFDKWKRGSFKALYDQFGIHLILVMTIGEPWSATRVIL